MSKQILKLDVDGVLRDCVSPLLDIYNEKYGDIVQYSDIVDWDIGKFLKHDKNYKQYFRKYGKKIFENGPLYNRDTSDIIKQLHEKYYIHIVTDQLKGNEIYTVNWLYNNNIEYDALSFTRNKNNIVGDILLDDGIHNLMSSHDSDELPICFTQPWNKGFIINKDWIRTLRIDSLEELL